MWKSDRPLSTSSKYSAISSAPRQVLSGKRWSVSLVHICLSVAMSRRLSASNAHRISSALETSVGAVAIDMAAMVSNRNRPYNGVSIPSRARSKKARNQENESLKPLTEPPEGEAHS